MLTRRACLARLLAVAGVPAASALAQSDRERALDAATIAVLRDIGSVDEQRFTLRGTGSATVVVQGRTGRRSSTWFSYDMPVDRSNAVAVVVTYNSALEWFCQFTVSVDGERVGEEFMPPRQEARFFDVHYGVPSGVATGKDIITVRFTATGGDDIAPVFAVRTIRA
jgi:hypothetical protein